MQIPIVIEAIEGGRYRARTGGPLELTVEGDAPDEVRSAMERLIGEYLRRGAQLSSINVPDAVSVRKPLRTDNAYLTDPTYAEMQELIAQHRREEEEESARP
jgi:hypothetical protein